MDALAERVTQIRTEVFNQFTVLQMTVTQSMNAFLDVISQSSVVLATRITNLEARVAQLEQVINQTMIQNAGAQTV